LHCSPPELDELLELEDELLDEELELELLEDELELELLLDEELELELVLLVEEEPELSSPGSTPHTKVPFW
jgi:hypothetical protein